MIVGDILTILTLSEIISHYINNENNMNILFIASLIGLPVGIVTTILSSIKFAKYHKKGKEIEKQYKKYKKLYNQNI